MSLTKNERYTLEVKNSIDHNQKQVTIKINDTLLFDELCNYAYDKGYSRVYFTQNKVKSSSGASLFFISERSSSESIELIGVFERE